jgi:acetyl-CoA carboxylase carboxyltransferase component
MAAVTASLRIRGGVTGTVSVGVERLGRNDAVLARTSSDHRRGALAERDGDSLAEAARSALALRLPLVMVLSSSGADVSDGVAALHGWGGAAAAVAACSGIVPVVAVATGPVISGPALLLGLADVVVMSEEAVAFVSGPQMVADFTGVRLGMEQLGGAEVHAKASGLCCLESARPLEAAADVLDFLPANADLEPPTADTDDPVDRPVPELRSLVPTRDNASYDVRGVAAAVADDGDVLELRGRWAPQLVTAFIRIGGRPIGVVANQPRALAGTLDIAASQKAARFVRLCDAFNIPILTLVDTPGFLPGKDLEWRGMIRHGAELAFAYAEAVVPRLCIILRKAFGGAYIVMDSKGLGNDFCAAWPGAEIAVMGAPGAVQILHRTAPADVRSELEDEYRAEFLTPWAAATRGFVDQVIDPAETRAVIGEALSLLCTKREGLVGRKHGVGPL